METDDWDGCLDGSLMENYIDQHYPDYVRAGVQNNGIIFINKKAFNKKLDKLSNKKIDKIVKRVRDRVMIDQYHTDYIDYYYELLDPIYMKVTDYEIKSIYVNLYDYILERISTNRPRNELKFLKQQIDNQIFQYQKWEDDKRNLKHAETRTKMFSAYRQVIMALKGLR